VRNCQQKLREISKAENNAGYSSPDKEDWRHTRRPTGKYTAREICKYFIPDFSNWKNHNEFQNAFGRLMVDGGFEGAGQRQWLVISVRQRGEWRS
jgi:hypothetical protein